VRSGFKVRRCLHFGQAQVCTTSRSPSAPSSCLSVAIATILEGLPGQVTVEQRKSRVTLHRIAVSMDGQPCVVGSGKEGCELLLHLRKISAHDRLGVTVGIDLKTGRAELFEHVFSLPDPCEGSTQLRIPVSLQRALPCPPRSSSSSSCSSRR